MTGKRAKAFLGLMLAAPLLSGCAAAIVPIMAGGALARTKLDRNHSSRKQAQKAEDAEAAALADASAPKTAGQAALAGEVGRDQVQIVSGALPPPSGTMPRTVADGPPGNGIAGLYAFADKEGTKPIVGSVRHSAMLANPGALDGVTNTCSVHPPAVLIDLDPKNGAFDPAKAMTPAPGLAADLARLRTDGVTIAWISSATADQAGAIDRALAASGLDPAGKDPLVLMRYPDDRKQTRRQDFAREYCVVAIAGDTRTDFDELYAYLKDPSAALALEKLLGHGWFLIPQPLS